MSDEGEVSEGEEIGVGRVYVLIVESRIVAKNDAKRPKLQSLRYKVVPYEFGFVIPLRHYKWFSIGTITGCLKQFGFRLIEVLSILIIKRNAMF